MKFTKWSFIAFFGLLLATNLLWFLQTERIESSVKYHATHLCELQRLSILQNLLPDGSDGAVLDKFCNLEGYSCDKQSGVVFIEFDNLVSCPKSGRPFCGFRAEINDDNNVTMLTSGYPCH